MNTRNTGDIDSAHLRRIEAATRPDSTPGELALAELSCHLLAMTFSERIDVASAGQREEAAPASRPAEDA